MTQNVDPVLNFDSRIANRFASRNAILGVLVMASLSATSPSSASMACADLFAGESKSTSLSASEIIQNFESELAIVENDPQYEIKITGQELAADIVEAMLSNPSGFNHKDAENAIHNNLGDLAQIASDYVRDSNLWVNSSQLQKSMAELQYATDDFLSAAKRYQNLSSNSFFTRLKNFSFGGSGLKERRLKDLVQALQLSRNRVAVARNDLDTVMISFETLYKNFAGHYIKMQRSIAVVQGAIDEITIGGRLDAEEKSKAQVVLQRYMQNVTTSIGTSFIGLKALHMTFTNHDFTIQMRESELKTATDLMLNAGISAGILHVPFYVESSLKNNRYISADLIEIFYGGHSPEEIIQMLTVRLERSSQISLQELLVTLKLMPKGSSVRSNWDNLYSTMGRYQNPTTRQYPFNNDGAEWKNNGNLRSQDIILLDMLFQKVYAYDPDSSIEQSEYLRIPDYVDDILEASQTLKKDGLNGKLRKQIQAYIEMRSEVVAKHLPIFKAKAPK